MGTSIAMIERSYGMLITGASDSIADRLDALDRLATSGPVRAARADPADTPYAHG
jgi:hypothetical protein